MTLQIQEPSISRIILHRLQQQRREDDQVLLQSKILFSASSVKPQKSRRGISSRSLTVLPRLLQCNLRSPENTTSVMPGAPGLEHSSFSFLAPGLVHPYSQTGLWAHGHRETPKPCMTRRSKPTPGDVPRPPARGPNSAVISTLVT